MKIKPEYIISAAVALVIIIILVVVMVDTQAIIDWLTPHTNEEKERFYLAMTLGGAIALFFILRHTKPRKKWKIIKIKKN